MTRKKPRLSTEAAKPTQSIEPAPKSHLRFDDFDGEHELTADGILEEEDAGFDDDEALNIGDVDEGGSDGGASELDDEDEAPEAISAGAERRRAKELELAMREFEQVASQARRAANKSRDAKLKAARAASSQATKGKGQVDNTPGIDEEEDNVEGDDSVLAATKPTVMGQKRYLDPAIFASASDQLSQVAKEAKKLEAAQVLLQKKSEKKRKRVEAKVQRREINGLVYEQLANPTNRTAQPRHAGADKFVQARLHGNPKFRKSLPRTTTAAKLAIGQRKPTAFLNVSRRSGQPAANFARAA